MPSQMRSSTSIEEDGLRETIARLMREEMEKMILEMRNVAATGIDGVRRRRKKK